MVNVVNDANLRIAVIDRLNLDANYAPPISPSDMNHPTAIDMNRPSFTSLDANHLGISDLNGLEYATNLKTLYLADNNISDLGLLSGLKKMQYLRLWGNSNLANLVPLADMNNLLSFWAYDCNIADINAVSKFTKLVSLNLNLNNVTDLNALSGLTTLTYLNLNDNNIADINSLKNLTKLRQLYLSRNYNISDINAVKDMNSLSELGLTDVNLVDISPLADVNQIRYLWLGYNEITDISALTKDVNFIELNLNYNPLNFESWCVHLKTIINNKPSATITSNLLINDRFTDMIDLSFFASKWLRQDCVVDSDCGGADFSEDSNVDFYDFAIFANWWMYNK
ncbi:MAG: leucine-rich repeat domain-containing protein [Phycisphaerae bacterium]|nr:leucine-rich repeat domain-containing protein [Phycisphaerae bacterium]